MYQVLHCGTASEPCFLILNVVSNTEIIVNAVGSKVITNMFKF